jgi:hypothetical protein
VDDLEEIMDKLTGMADGSGEQFSAAEAETLLSAIVSVIHTMKRLITHNGEIPANTGAAFLRYYTKPMPGRN